MKRLAVGIGIFVAVCVLAFVVPIVALIVWIEIDVAHNRPFWEYLQGKRMLDIQRLDVKHHPQLFCWDRLKEKERWLTDAPSLAYLQSRLPGKYREFGSERGEEFECAATLADGRTFRFFLGVLERKDEFHMGFYDEASADVATFVVRLSDPIPLPFLEFLESLRQDASVIVEARKKYWQRD